LFSCSVFADFVEGRVTAEKLNVRVFPGLGYTCVCVLEKNDKIKILGKVGEWYQIEAPENAAVWVSNSFINDSQAGSGAKFRAGPSVAYEVYDKAAKDVKVELAGESDRFWTKIKPTSEPMLKAWINSKFVSIDKQDSGNIIPVAAPAGIAGIKKEIPPDVPKISENAASDKKENELTFVAGLPKTVALDGILMPLEKQENIITHSMNIKVNDEFCIVAYAYSLNDNLKLWEKRKVRIKGIQKWIKSWKRPIVEIEKISPIWN